MNVIKYMGVNFQLIEVNIEANAGNEIYTTYFYQDDIAAQNIYAGYDILKNESVRENILHYEYVIERYECKYPYLSITYS